MSNRKKISPEIRKAVYDKYNGHCAYCGCAIDYKNMQVDHLIPLRNWDGSHTEEELWSIENLMPSCRQCNHYKRANTLQDFREAIEQIPFKLNRDSCIYRIGIKYGMIEIKEHPVIFYFEKEGDISKLSFEEKIKLYCKIKGFSGERIFDAYGFSSKIITQYKKERVKPFRATLIKIAEILQIDSEKLVNNEKYIDDAGIENLSFGEKVRYFRENKGYSPLDLAKKIGFSNAQLIYKIEKHNYIPPNKKIEKRLAEALSVDETILFGMN